MNRDQNDVAPDVILGSAVIRIPEAFLEVARAWQEQALGGAPIYEGASAGVIDFVINPTLSTRVPAELVAAMDAARTRIRAGELEVPRVPFVETESGLR
jgi:simple sugar transport system substrate-binding protein/basic membrane protein A